MICQHAYNSNNELVFIDDVPTGFACNCFCPSCHQKMVAKNAGNALNRQHHFAHASGIDCGGYRESLLHIWSKQIIEQYKSFALPSYNNHDGYLFVDNPYDEKSFVFPAKLISFTNVEIEQRNDVNNLQPDIVGITDDGLRLWIEIAVTHKCSDDKIAQIKELNINCIEAEIPKSIESKDQLQDFLLNSTDPDTKHYLNFPYGDNCINRDKKDFYNILKSKYRVLSLEECNHCFKHIFLEKVFSKLLQDYKFKLPPINYFDYRYIYKSTSFQELVNTHPNSKYTLNYIIHQRHDYRSSLSSLDEDRFNILCEFIGLLGEMMKRYDYGSIRSIHWNCPHIKAESIKNDKLYVFCDLKN
jgi:hypothetical protein